MLCLAIMGPVLALAFRRTRWARTSHGHLCGIREFTVCSGVWYALKLKTNGYKNSHLCITFMVTGL